MSEVDWYRRALELENQLTLMRAERDGLGAVLLEVQQDCVAQRKRGDAAEQQVASLREDEEDSHATFDRMSKLLTDVAAALKGEPDELTLHSWHDLPELAAAAAKDRDGLREAREASADLPKTYNDVDKIKPATDRWVRAMRAIGLRGDG